MLLLRTIVRSNLKKTVYLKTLKTLSKLRWTPLPPTLFLTKCWSCWPPSLSRILDKNHDIFGFEFTLSIIITTFWGSGVQTENHRVPNILSMPSSIRSHYLWDPWYSWIPDIPGTLDIPLITFISLLCFEFLIFLVFLTPKRYVKSIFSKTRITRPNFKKFAIFKQF